MTSPAGSAPPRPRRLAAGAALSLALFVHGVPAGALGLYWDDAVQLVQPFQRTQPDAVAFITFDGAGNLVAERPAAYFAFMITRAAFVLGLGAVHWTLVGVFLVTVTLLMRLARRVLDRDWFVFAAGAAFAVYPFAPLQTIWPATVHYQVSCLLALASTLAALRFMEARQGRRGRWLVATAAALAMSLLTHEGFAFVPPAVLAAYAVVAHGRAARWAAMAPIGLHVGVLALYAAWRTLLLPLHGEVNYAMTLAPLDVARNVVVGGLTALFPWRGVAFFLYEARPAAIWVASAVAAGVATWLISAWLWARDPGEDEARPWARAAWLGLAVFAAGAVAVAMSPVALRAVFGVDFGPRANFVVTPGLALTVPAVLVLLARWASRAPALTVGAGLVGLLWVGLVGTPDGGGLVSYRSHAPVLFGRYSMAYGLILLVYGLAVAGAALALVVVWRRPRADRLGVGAAGGETPVLQTAGRLALIGLFAGLVTLGSLVHLGAKQRFAEEWKRQRTLLQALRQQAPVLADETFVVIVDDRGGSHPWATHDDVVSYLLALYENPSVTGNTLAHLRFHADGVESRYHDNVRWVPPDGGRVGYDRLVLFEHAAGVLRPLPALEVTTAEGDRLLVKSNAGRILPMAPASSVTWRHVDR